MKLADLMALSSAAPQPAPVALPLDTTHLDQTEAIRPHMLAELAARLVKRKSDKIQQIGRAVSSAVRGEAFAGVNHRNATLLLIAHAILEAYPYCDPDTVVDCFSASLSVMASQSPAGNPAPTPAEFRSMLVRFQSEHQSTHYTLDRLVKTAQAYPSPNQPGVASAIETPAQPGALSWRNIIVQCEGSFYLRHPSASVYGIYCDSKTTLRIDLCRYFIDGGQAQIKLTDERGETLAIDTILDAYCSNARSTIYDYAKRYAEFDPTKEKLTVGYEMGSIEREPITPQFDPRVDLWLREFAGGTDHDLCELYDWIASTDQRYITTTAAALAIQGEADVGKTLFARALAHTWGLLEPVTLRAAVDRFNGPLQRCPIWFADERMPDELTDAIFREMVQSRQRDIEPKGKEKVILRGCARILIAVNELADIRIGGAQGPKAAKAVADRLSLFVPTIRTSEALMSLRGVAGSNDAELMTIVRHLRWAQTELTPRVQRFLGARANRTAAMVPILRSCMAQQPEAFQAIREYLSNYATWERDYGTSVMHAGKRFPIITDGDQIWVTTSELAARIHVQPWRLANALKAFAADGAEDREMNFAGLTQLYVSIDPTKIEGALGVDPIPAMVPGTRDRMTALGLLRP